MTETEILKQAIVNIIDIEIGVYPKAFQGKYEERNDYQNGWNACYMRHLEEVTRILGELNIHVTGDNAVTVKADP